jgi:hypothetical protein
MPRAARADQYAAVTVRHAIRQQAEWDVTRTHKGVRFNIDGVRFYLRHDAAISLADALIDAAEQDPPPAPALQLVA